MQLEKIKVGETVWIEKKDLTEDQRICEFSVVRGEDEEFDRTNWEEVRVLDQHRLQRLSDEKVFLTE